MATFRCKSILVCALLSLACMTRGPEAAAPAAGIEMQLPSIEHLSPRRDAVGPLPARLEWSAVAGADSYRINVENEVDVQIFDQFGITTTSVPWPKEVRLDPGTYFWRIVALSGDRVLADSGRAAFVVQER